MSSLRNISGNDGEYKMSHSLFVIHVALSTLILVAGVCVNTISVGVIVRLKLARETSVLFTLHLMIVNHRYVRFAGELVSFIRKKGHVL